MNRHTETPQEVVERELADWLAERAAASRNQAELEVRVNAYIEELKQADAAMKSELKQIDAANKPVPDAPLPQPDKPLPLQRTGWLDMVLAVLRGLTW